MYLEAQAFQTGAHDLRKLVLAHLRHLAPGVQVPAPPGLYTTRTAAALPGAGLRDPGREQALDLIKKEECLSGTVE